MGDLVEITTWPNHQNVFYLMTGSALAFEVKASGNAVIELSKDVNLTARITIILDENRKSSIRNQRDQTVVDTPHLLSQDEFRKFWITWNAGVVCVGRENNAVPFLKHDILKQGLLNYITFHSLHETGNPVHWKFTVPPLKEEPKTKLENADGKLHWVQCEAGAPLPDDALIAGYEDEPLYIMRAAHAGSLTPGKYVRTKGLGYLGWSWDEHVKTSFEILCGFDGVWVPTSHSLIPPGAFVGGYSENHAVERLYIGRAKHEGHIIPGKVQCSHNVCFIPYDGKELAVKHYEILTVPHDVPVPLSNYRN